LPSIHKRSVLLVFHQLPIIYIMLTLVRDCNSAICAKCVDSVENLNVTSFTLSSL